jgi:hypothetical protein
MAEERQRDHWSHTSLVLSVLANIHRDPKRAGRYSADDFNPFSARRPVTIRAGVGILKQVFVDRPRGDAK